MIYLTHTRLMHESEHSVHARADHGEAIPRHVCGQLVGDSKRYSLWLSKQDRGMRGVAGSRYRDQQMLTLRQLLPPAAVPARRAAAALRAL